MNISLFPRLSKSEKLPGVLSFSIEDAGHTYFVNCVPGVMKRLCKRIGEKKELIARHNIILSSVNPINLSAVEELAALIKDDVINVNEAHALAPVSLDIYSPVSVSGWFKALLMETDYSSEKLKNFPFRTYSTKERCRITGDKGVNIEHIPDKAGFFDYIIKFDFANRAQSLYFCELADMTASFPEELKGAALAVINLSKYPSIEGVLDCDDYIEDIAAILSKNGVKAAILPAPEGILLLLPSEKPAGREYLEEEFYDFQVAGVKCAISHERSFSNYKNSIFPILVEDDAREDRILLGLDLGAVLHQRLNTSGKFDFNSIIIPSNSYHKVFTCVDMIDQIKDKYIQIICGRHMAEAVKYFKGIFVDLYNRNVEPNVYIASSEEGRTTEHIFFTHLEILMIPFPGSADYSIARIRDNKSGDVLIYTENIANPVFLEKNLQGIDNLVVSLESTPEESVEKQVSFLKSLQKKHKIGRMIIMHSKGTEMCTA